MALRAPQGLRPAESKLWKRVVAEFGADHLEASDAPLVLGLALLYGRLDDLRSLLFSQQTASASKGDDRRELPYLLEKTSRGTTTNPLISHERETIREIRLLHERLSKVIGERGAGVGGPASLAQMRRRLEEPETTRRPRAV